MLACSLVMAPMRRRSWLAGALAALALSVAGCASPTLPLPPPERPETISFGEDGVLTLKGSAQPEAIVYAFNERSEEGVITKASGSGIYLLKIQAVLGDEIAVWQEVGSERSASVIIQARKP